MTGKPDRLSRTVRFWGKVGMVFFFACALVLAGITLVEGQFTPRAVLVICALASLGLIALALARLYEWILRKLASRD